MPPPSTVAFMSSPNRTHSSRTATCARFLTLSAAQRPYRDSPSGDAGKVNVIVSTDHVSLHTMEELLHQVNSEIGQSSALLQVVLAAEELPVAASPESHIAGHRGCPALHSIALLEP